MYMGKTHGVKAEWELYKNATYCLEQIPEATYHKIAIERPPNSHLTNHPIKTNKMLGTAVEEKTNL